MNPQPPLPDDAELDELAAQVDAQFNALMAAFGAHPPAFSRGAAPAPGEPAPPPDAPEQRAVLERAAGQPFANFWPRFLGHLRRDLCLPGGQLHEQWKKYLDLESKSAVRVSYGWLAAMGIPTGSLAPAAVAATVFLLNVLAKVGIDTVCEGCAADPKDGG